MQYDVFISYARKDYIDEQTKEIIPGNIVSRIKQLLDENDISYWFDETGIYSGDQFVGVLADAIEQSSIFLYISTEASNASKWTINEIATAKHLDKKIIPFRCDNSKYNNSILMYLAPLDYIDYPKSKDKAFGQLLVSIKAYKQSVERAEQEALRVAEQAKKREQEALEHQKMELQKQIRIREINQQLEILSAEIQKKREEQARINIILEGLETRWTNLNGELAFLTGKNEPVIKEIKEKKGNKTKRSLTSVVSSLSTMLKKCGNFWKCHRILCFFLLFLLLILCVWGILSHYSLIDDIYRFFRRFYLKVLK